MTIRGLIAQNDQVALEIDWHGTTAAPMGDAPAGSPSATVWPPSSLSSMG